MIQLAEEVFAVKEDPEQLNVDQEVIQRLQHMHPATVSEFDDGHGPVAWILLLPTTLELMNQFLRKQISEKEMFEQTPIPGRYEAVYLCSAMVLEEYRRKGIAKRLIMSALQKIRLDHSIQYLFVWAFTKAGDQGSETVARLASLPLLKRQDGR